MTHENSHLGRGGDENEQLDELLYDYVDRLNAGEILDKERIREEQPVYADALIEKLQIFEGVGAALEPENSLGTLGGYNLRRQIGRGGMGVVYEAWESSMDRVVALKVLPAGVAADDHAFERFTREARTAGKLSHPNVVPVYFTGVEEQTPFYTMEYVEGETLAQLLASTRDAKIDTETPFGRTGEPAFYSNVAKAFADVADGLQHAHSKGVIHRDIKPSNLILDGSATASSPGSITLRILDFGLARLEGQEGVTVSGDVVGTPLYMSPEQARREQVPVDHRTDLYSLGATLYETLCGRPTFRGRDHADTLSQIVDRDPAEPRKVNPRVPKDLETIVLKCLRKDAGDRYGTAEALAQDLRRFVRGDPIEARPQGRWERISRNAWRHRWRLTISAAACLAVLAIGLLSWQWRNAEEEAWRLLHDAAVGDAARDLFRGQLTIFGEYGERVTGFGIDTLFSFRGLQFKRGRTGVQATLDALEQAAAAVPERPDAPYYLALTYRLLGEEEAATREAERALERQPDFVPAEVLEAEIAHREFTLPRPELDRILSRYQGEGDWQESWLLAYGHVRDGNWAEAAADYDRLVLFWRRTQCEPYVGFAVEILVGRGVVHLHQRHFQRAVRDFSAASGIWPSFPEAALALATTYYRAGDEAQSDVVFEELYSASSEESRNEVATWIAGIYAGLHDGKRCGAWYDRVTGWEKNRLNVYSAFFHYRRDEVITEARKVLEEQPDDLHARLALSWAQLGRQWNRVGVDWDRKREDLLAFASETAAFYPSDPHTRCALAMALLANGRDKEALAAAESALDLQRRIGVDRHDAYATLAVIQRSRGDTSTAETTLRDALKKFRGSGSLRHELALTLEKAGKYEDALEEYRKVARPGRRATRARSRIAGILNMQGQYEEAIQQARAALEHPPSNTGAHEHLAYALWKQGQTNEALEVVERGIERIPGRARLHFLRGSILESAGRVREAAKEYCAEFEMCPDCTEVCEALTNLLVRHPELGSLPEVAALAQAMERARHRNDGCQMSLLDKLSRIQVRTGEG